MWFWEHGMNAKFIVAVIVVGMMAGLREARAAGVVAPPARAGVVAHGPVNSGGEGHRPINHHLRLPTPTAPAAKRAKTGMFRPKAVKPGQPTHSVRRRHVSVVRRFAGHVSGTVRDAKGSYVGGASVRLAKPKGRRIRNPHLRHSTVTDAGGGYTMHAVRAGSYRVVASKSGLGKGHSPLSIRSSGLHRVDVKLSGGKVKKKRSKF